MALLQFPEDERTDAVGEATIVSILQPMDTRFYSCAERAKRRCDLEKYLGVQDVTQARFIFLDSDAW